MGLNQVCVYRHTPPFLSDLDERGFFLPAMKTCRRRER
jgi:hypothetical protein